MIWLLLVVRIGFGGSNRCTRLGWCLRELVVLWTARLPTCVDAVRVRTKCAEQCADADQALVTYTNLSNRYASTEMTFSMV
jgi:hypothetical protein